MNPPQMSLNIPTIGWVGSSASRAIHSGWVVATSDSGATMNGAIQMPGVEAGGGDGRRPPPSTPDGNLAFVASQSPMSGW